MLDLIKELSKGQGVYGRLLQALNEADEDRNQFLDSFEDCSNPIDVILRIEGLERKDEIKMPRWGIT